MIVKLLTEHHLEFLSFKGCCRGSFESLHVKIPHCWKSHATAQIKKLKLILPSFSIVSSVTPILHIWTFFIRVFSATVWIRIMNFMCTFRYANCNV